MCVCVPASYCLFLYDDALTFSFSPALVWRVGGRAGTWSYSIILSSKWKWMNLFELTHMLTDQSYEKSICSTYSAVVLCMTDRAKKWVDSSSRRQVLKSREVDDLCCSRGYCHVYQKWKVVVLYYRREQRFVSYFIIIFPLRWVSDQKNTRTGHKQITNSRKRSVGQRDNYCCCTGTWVNDLL